MKHHVSYVGFRGKFPAGAREVKEAKSLRRKGSHNRRKRKIGREETPLP